MKSLYNCALFVCYCFCLFQRTTTELVNVFELQTGWTLTNQNESIIIKNLSIPSGVYSAYAGESVLDSYNDINLRWLAYDNWTYSIKFTVKQHNKTQRQNLTFHGIDTVAEIRLNHELLGRTNNMFVFYTYDVTSLLEEENLLEVEIKSAVYAAKAQAHIFAAQNASIPPLCPPKRYNGECHINMLRKMQASFAWDWGLAVPSMGIWKSVTLEVYEVAILRDVDVGISKNNTHWNMDITVYMDVGGKHDFHAELQFYAVELLTSAITIDDYISRPISHKHPIINFQQAVPITHVREWWPNGYGEQKLYPLHFSLNSWIDIQGPRARSKTISQKTLRIGFRTIELVEDPVSNGHGNTFFFKINGQEIFMKGTNYIPSHILPEMSGDEKRIKYLLQAAKDAHMNMIRVWGGGIYESDYFYNMADELGILIWQDMMFACAMYPATREFLNSVRMEVIQNAKRLSSHPSIAIFATNNENEVALAQNWYGTLPYKKRFEFDYRSLYVGTIIHELKMIDHQNRPSPLVSSPSNGKESANENYLSSDPQNPNFGDVHFYDIFGDAWNADIFPRPRFSSEYGFQSLPCMQSWLKALGPIDDLWQLINHRQHHPTGMMAFTNLVFRHLPLPLPEDRDYVEALIYFSQIAQAMATKTETELYRSLRDTQYRTMGALYWQLNDVWVAPSWSSIDFYGNFKLLQYWAKEFMAPISIIALSDSSSGTINVSLVCDQLKVNTTGLSVTMNIHLWTHLLPMFSITWPATLKPNGVHYDKIIPVNEIFATNFTTKNSFLEFTLQRDNNIFSSTYLFPAPIKSAVGVSDPKISVEFTWKYCHPTKTVAKNNFSLLINVEKPAIFVYIEVIHPKIDKYLLSRNGYMQVTPTQLIHLELETVECINLTNANIKITTVNKFMLK